MINSYEKSHVNLECIKDKKLNENNYKKVQSTKNVIVLK